MRVASLVLAGMLASCASTEPLAEVNEPTASVSGLFPRLEALDRSVLSVKVDIQNPKDTSLRIREILYALDTGEVAGVLKGRVDADTMLAADQQAELGFDVDIQLPRDHERLRSLRTLEAVLVDLRGEVRFAKGASAPFAKRAEIAIPSLPEFVVFDAQAAVYGTEEVDVTLFLRLVNNNPFRLSLREIDYVVTLNGEELRSAHAGVGSQLAVGGAEEFEVNIRLNRSSFEGFEEVLAEGVVEYRVAGEVATRELAIPFENIGEIRFEDE